jgi:predicted aspartyl protease
MPLLTTTTSNLRTSGPIIEVLISPSQALRRILEEKQQLVPQPLQKIMLIDTGASASAIKTGIAKELNLRPHGTITISTASHKSVICLTYDVDITFKIQKVAVLNVRVFESNFEGQPIDGLIGRDILSQGLLIYNGYDNAFTIGF